MRTTVLSLLIFLAFSMQTMAQEGLPFVTDIGFDRQFNDSRIGSMVQDSDESMFFTTSRGVLKYDGDSWIRINTPSPVLRIHRHVPSDRIFAGLQSGAVEIMKTDSGTYRIQPIAGIDTDRPLTRILSTDKDVFLLGETDVFRYSPLPNEPAEHFEYPKKRITGAFIHRNDLYILFYKEGLFKWMNGILEEVGAFSELTEEPMLFSFETTEGTFMGFENDVLYTFNGTRVKPVNNELSTFLSDNILSDGLTINDSLMAFSTLAGGAVVVNIQSGRIRYRFDYTTGIKDNEIFCLGTDRDQGLWLAYESGLSRVDLVQPVKEFSGYPGLKGSMTSSIVLNGQLHVATGNGVFVLKETKDRAEIQRIIAETLRRKQEANKREVSNYVPPRAVIPAKQREKAKDLIQRYRENPEAVKKELSKKELRELKKKIRQYKRENKKDGAEGNALEKLFKGNNQKQNGKEEGGDKKVQSGPDVMRGLTSTPTDGPAGSGMTAPPGSGTIERKKPTLLDAKEEIAEQIKDVRKSYLFRKVKALDVKCRQLLSWNGKVYAATNNGLYLIEDETAKNLTPDVYINQAVVSKNGKSLLLATLSGVYRLQQEEGKWQFTALNDSVQFVVYNVVQDADGSVWAGTDNGAYRYFLDETRFYSVPEIVNERVLVADIYDQVHFLLPSGLYHYVAAQDTVLRADLPEIPSSSRLDYLLGNSGVIWVRSNYGWHVLNGDRYIPMLPYLDLFEDIRNLSTDADGNLYVIDRGTDLYSVLSKHPDGELPFNVYIGQALDADGIPFPLGKLSVDADNNQFTFTISAPFYLQSRSTQYQYRIEGFRNTWSKWSYETNIDQYMPSGNYVLQVRAKNVLGEVSEIKSLSFTVQKPIWVRWYFILLYIAVILLALFGLIKVRERSLRQTQRELETKVKNRTADLAKAKDRAEELLLNILPKETADELQKNGKATARHYNQVSVLFTDFKGFTRFAENTSPQHLVNELDERFRHFDDIIEKYGLEKIKTIGDAYMCAGGVPIKNSSNAIATTLAALEIRDHMNKVVAMKRQKNEPVLEIRIGIHTGPLTAGVVGKKKFAYDIWGDTVNTASRMETASKPGQVNVSGTTFQLIKKYFETESRGKLEAKGKGLVEMYFVKSIRPEYSEDGMGMSPNKRMWDILD